MTVMQKTKAIFCFLLVSAAMSALNQEPGSEAAPPPPPPPDVAPPPPDMAPPPPPPNEVAPPAAPAANKIQPATQVPVQLDGDVVALVFPAGDSTVSTSQRSDLKTYVDRVAKDRKLDTLVVAAWSDRSFPRAKNVSLSKEDGKLADARKDNAVKALKELGAKDVRAYSMVKHSGRLAQAFGTKKAYIVGDAHSSKGGPTSWEHIGELVREYGGPGKVVVVARYKR